MTTAALSPDAVFVSCRGPRSRIASLSRPGRAEDALDRLGDRIEQLEFTLTLFLTGEGGGPLAARLDAIEARLDAILSRGSPAIAARRSDLVAPPAG